MRVLVVVRPPKTVRELAMVQLLLIIAEHAIQTQTMIAQRIVMVIMQMAPQAVAKQLLMIAAYVLAG